MSYDATWTNGNAQGRLEAGEHFVRLCDPQELAEAVNRRRLLTYQFQQDFTAAWASGEPVRQSPVSSADAPPFDNLRKNIATNILQPGLGGLGGEPATPQALDWLWPLADADAGKKIVTGQPGEGQVNLFEKLNGTAGWTDATLLGGQSGVRAVHFNELRQSIEWLRRGRWELPIYFTMGIFSPMPEMDWIGEYIGKNELGQELRSIGYSVFRTGESPPRGLADVTARSSSYIELLADTDCSVAVHHVIRHLEPYADPPTWNEYQTGAPWASAGALGSGDSRPIGSVSLTAEEPGAVGGATLADELTKIVDGEEPYFLVRRTDVGPETIFIQGTLVIEFDLDSPPN